jgi:hypothetical protein
VTQTIHKIEFCDLYHLCVIVVQPVWVIFMLHYTLHTWLYKYSSKCNLSHQLLTAFCLSWQVEPSCCHHQLKLSGDVLLDCLKVSQYPRILKNFTNRTLSRSWYVGMMTVQFFSFLSMAKVRGIQKNSLLTYSEQCTSYPSCLMTTSKSMVLHL